MNGLRRSRAHWGGRGAILGACWTGDGLLHRFALEDIEPGHWVAYALDLPGCFSTAPSEGEAVAQAPAAVAAYCAWLVLHRRPARLAHPIAVQVVEVVRAVEGQDGYLINAFFADDVRPLSQSDSHEALWLLGCSREDLAAAVAPCARSQLSDPRGEGTSWSVARVLAHIADAEWWYLSRLNLVPHGQALPHDPIAKLEVVRARTHSQLPGLVRESRVVERQGERWSARKLVRRALWHEREHTQELLQLLRR